MTTAAELIRQHLNDDIYTLSARSRWHEPYDKRWLLQQIQSRQKAKSKLPSWYGNFDLLFPPPLSVEQCSSELTASYKAALAHGGSLIDMTGGMGVDAAAFARRCTAVTFIERQPEVAEAARHNFPLLGLRNIEVVCGDSTELLAALPSADHIYLDPARRKAGQKVFRLEDCEPDLLQLLPLLRTHTSHLLVKLSPLIDLTLLQRQLPGITTLHIVSVHHEVKEVLAEVRFDQPAEVPDVVCVELAEPSCSITFHPTEQQNNKPVLAESVETYLYEPHPTVMKSGLMDVLAVRYDLRKLHYNSHLYTSPELHPDYFGRIFAVQSVFGMGKRELKEGLEGVTQACITTRNFPLKAEELRRKLKLNDGGEVTLLGTTVADGRHVLIRCESVTPPSATCSR